MKFLECICSWLNLRWLIDISILSLSYDLIRFLWQVTIVWLTHELNDWIDQLFNWTSWLKLVSTCWYLSLNFEIFPLRLTWFDFDYFGLIVDWLVSMYSSRYLNFLELEMFDFDSFLNFDFYLFELKLCLKFKKKNLDIWSILEIFFDIYFENFM